MPLNLNATLALNGPTNLNQILGNIRSQLGNINSNVNLQVNDASIKSAITSIKQATSATEELGIAAGNATRKFFGFTAVVGTLFALVSAIRNATSEAIAFDRSMNKIAQLGGDTKASLKGLEDQITSLSTSLGVSSKSLVDVSLVLKQTGLSAEDVRISLSALAKTELAPSFENIKNTTEGVISIFSQFKHSANDLERDLGGINTVAADFAVESADLVEAVRRTGSSFKSLGGDMNELLALFTSVRATTRESADSIATGLRTIFTRVQRNDTVEALKDLGIQLRYTQKEADSLGQSNLRDQFVGGYEAVRRLSSALKDLPGTDPRTSAIVEQLGGYRQISKVIPLIQEFSTAQKAYASAQAGANSLTLASEKAQESYAVKLQKVNEQFQALFRTIISSNAFKGFVDTALSLATAFIKVADALTPLIPLLTVFATIKVASSLASFTSGVFQGITGAASPKKFAGGGSVPGHGNSDSIPAMLQPGEFVIKKDSAQKIGHDKLHQINAEGYASGGKVKLKNEVVALTTFGASDANAKATDAPIKEALASRYQKSSGSRITGVEAPYTVAGLNESVKTDINDIARDQLTSAVNQVSQKAFSGVKIRNSISSKTIYDKFGGAALAGNIFEGALNQLREKGISKSSGNDLFDFENVGADDFSSIYKLNKGFKLGDAKNVSRKSSVSSSIGDKLGSYFSHASLGQVNQFVDDGDSLVEKQKKANGGFIQHFAEGGSVVNKRNIVKALRELKGDNGLEDVDFKNLVSNIGIVSKDNLIEEQKHAYGINTAKGTDDNYIPSSIELNKDTIKSYQQLKGTLAHEFGHSVDTYLGRKKKTGFFASETPGTLENKVGSLQGLGIRDNLEKRINDKDYINYASDPIEGFAEAFRENLTGKARSTEASSLLDNIYGDLPKRKKFAEGDYVPKTNSFTFFKGIGYGISPADLVQLKKVAALPAEEIYNLASYEHNNELYPYAKYIINSGKKTTELNKRNTDLQDVKGGARSQYKQGKIQGGTLYIPVDPNYIGLVTQGEGARAGDSPFTSDTGIANKSNNLLNSYFKLGGVKKIAGSIDTHIVSKETSADYQKSVEGEVQNSITDVFKKRFPQTSKGLDLSLPSQDLKSVSGHLFEKYISGLTKTQSQAGTESFDFPGGFPNQEFTPFLHPNKVRAKYVDVKLNFRKSYVSDLAKKYLDVISQDGRLANILGVDPKDAQARAGVSDILSQKGAKSPQGFAHGGSAGTDTVPAVLTPGEFVLNKQAAQKIGPASLHRMNRTGEVHGYAKGGFVKGYAQGDLVTGKEGINDYLIRKQTEATQFAFNSGAGALSGNIGASAKNDAEKKLIETITKDIQARNENISATTAETLATNLVTRAKNTNAKVLLNPNGDALHTEKFSQAVLPQGSIGQVAGERATAEVFKRGGPDLLSGQTKGRILLEQQELLKAQYVANEVKLIEEEGKKRGIYIKSAESLATAEERYAEALKKNTAIIDSNGDLKNDNVHKGNTFFDRLRNGDSLRGNEKTVLTQDQIDAKNRQNENRQRNSQALFALTAATSYYAPGIADNIFGKVGTDNTTKSAAFGQGLSGAAVGASSGATGASLLSAIPALSALGTPLGLAAGAGVGAILGFVESLKAAQKEIRAIDLAKSLQELSVKIANVNSGLLSNTSGNISGIKEQIGEQQNKIYTDNIESNRGYFSTDYDKANKKTDLDTKQLYQQIFPGLSEIKDKGLEAAAKSSVKENINVSPAEIVAKFKQSSGGLAEEFLRIQHEVTRLPFSVLEQQLLRTAISLKEIEKAKASDQKAAAAEALTTNSYVALNNALTQAIASTSKFTNELNDSAAAFEGSQRSFKLDYKQEALTNLGSPNAARFQSANDIATAPFGDVGASLNKTLSEVDDLARNLPNIIASNARRNALAPESAIQNIGDAATKGKPGTTTDLFNQVLDNLKPDDIVRKQLNPDELTKELLKNFKPIQDVTVSISKQLSEEMDKLVGNLSKNNQLLNSINGEKRKGDELNLGSQKAEATLAATRAGRSSYLDFLPVAQQLQPFQNQQERLSGLKGGAALDPAAIAARLGGLEKQISEAQANRQKLLENRGSLEANNQATKEIKDLEREAGNAKNALRNLADSTERASVIQERLASATEDRDSVRQYGRKLLTSSPQEYNESQQGIQLLIKAQQQNFNIGNFTQEQRAKTFKAADDLGNSKLTGAGFDGITGKDVANKLIDNTIGKQLGIDTRNDKVTENQKILAEFAKTAAEAENKLVVALIANQETFAKTIDDAFIKAGNSLSAALKEGVNQILVGSARTDLAQKSNSLGESQKKVEAKTQLEGFGIRDSQTLYKVRGQIGELGKLRDEKISRDSLQKNIEKVSSLDSGDVLQTLTQGATRYKTGRFKTEDIFSGVQKFGTQNNLSPEIIAQIKTEISKASVGINGIDSDDISERKLNKVVFSIPGILQKELDDKKSNISSTTTAISNKIGLSTDHVGELSNPYSESLTRLTKSSDTIGESFNNADANVKGFTLAVENAKIKLQDLSTNGESARRRDLDVKTGPLPEAIATGGVAGSRISDYARGTDTVDAVLTPGEFVINRASAQANRSLLEKINNSKSKLHLADGGDVLDDLSDEDLPDAFKPLREIKRISEAARKRTQDAKDKELKEKVNNIRDNQAQAEALRDKEFNNKKQQEEQRLIERRDKVNKGNQLVAIPKNNSGYGDGNAFPETDFQKTIRLRREREAAAGVAQADNFKTGLPVEAKPNGFATDLAKARNNQAATPNFDSKDAEYNEKKVGGDPAFAAIQAKNKAEREQRDLARASFEGFKDQNKGLSETDLIAAARQSGDTAILQGANARVAQNQADKQRQKANSIRYANISDAQTAYDEHSRSTDEANRFLREEGSGYQGRATTVLQQVEVSGRLKTGLERISKVEEAKAKALRDEEAIKAGRKTEDEIKRATDIAKGPSQVAQGIGAAFGGVGVAGVFGALATEAKGKQKTVISAPNNGEFVRGLGYYDAVTKKYVKNKHDVGRGFATGGFAGSDTIPAMLSAGEYVVNAKATQKIGVDNLNRMNRFADGGLVTNNGASSANSAGGSQSGLVGVAEFGTSVKEFGSSITIFSDVLKTFVSGTDSLTKALTAFPHTLTGSFSHNVVVTITGADAFESMKDTLGKMVVAKTKEVLRTYIAQNMPDAGPVTDIES